MSVFQNKPEEMIEQWAGLPSEPLEQDSVDALPAPAADLFAVDFGSTTSIVFPVKPAPPAAESVETAGE